MAAGLALGLLVSWAAIRLVKGMPFGVTASDPLRYGGALLILFPVALPASGGIANKLNVMMGGRSLRRAGEWYINIATIH